MIGLNQHSMYGGFGSYAFSLTAEQDAKFDLTKVDQTTRTIATQNLFMYALDRYVDNFYHIEEARRAYFGDAWPEEVRRYRESQRLPVSNINMFMPVVEAAVGSERHARNEVRLFPVELDDEKSAELLSLFLQHTSRVNREHYYETDVMARVGAVGGRAHREWQWDFSDDPFGELKQYVWPPSEVMIDPDFTDYNTLDGDAKYRFHMQWITPYDLKNQYGGRNIDWIGLEYVPERTQNWGSHFQTEGVDDKYTFPSYRRPTMFWKGRDYVRLVRMWKYNWRPIYRLLDGSATDPRQVHVGDFQSKQQAEKLRLQLGLLGYNIGSMTIQEAKQKYCSYHVISGNVELDWQPDIGRYWPWNDYFATALEGKVVGLWNTVKDRQIWINATAAKILERMGRIGGMPAFIEEGIVIDEVHLGELWRDGKPIIVKEGALSQTAQSPIKIERDHSIDSLPAFVQLIEVMKNDIKQSSSFGDVQSGRAPGGVTAASALAILQSEGQKQTSGYSSNMGFTRSLNAELKLYLLRRAYEQWPSLAKYKMERIVGATLMRQDDPEMRAFIMQRMLDGGIDWDAILSNLKTVKYDLQEDVNSENMLQRAQKIQELQLFGQNGGVIPPELLLEIFRSLSTREKDILRKGIMRTEEAKAQLTGMTADQANVAGKVGAEGAPGAANNLPGLSERQNTSMTNPLSTLT